MNLEGLGARENAPAGSPFNKGGFFDRGTARKNTLTEYSQSHAPTKRIKP